MLWEFCLAPARGIAPVELALAANGCRRLTIRRANVTRGSRENIFALCFTNKLLLACICDVQLHFCKVISSAFCESKTLTRLCRMWVKSALIQGSTFYMYNNKPGEDTSTSRQLLLRLPNIHTSILYLVNTLYKRPVKPLSFKQGI